jgi:hypothetical protein
MTRAALALVAVLVLPAAALAVPPGLEYTPPPPPAPPSASGLVFKMVALTALMLSVCGAVLWFARRAGAQPVGPGPAGRMALEGSLALDRRSTLHLVRVDGLMVAVTTDATGLRALVLLSEPFGDMLDATAAPPA